MAREGVSSAEQFPKKRRFQRARFWFVGIVILLGVVALFIVPAMRGPIVNGRIHTCMNNMREIGIALNLYEGDHGTLPPAYITDENGRPMHSWRVLILPQLGYQDLYDAYRFDEPWNGPNNSKLIEQMPVVYQCPSYTHQDHPQTGEHVTHYVLPVGPKAIFRGAETLSRDEVSDGTDKTIMLIEINRPVSWMEPKDIATSELSASIHSEEEHNHGDGFLVLFADGHVNFLSSEISPDVLQALVTADEGDKVPTDAF